MTAIGVTNVPIDGSWRVRMTVKYAFIGAVSLRRQKRESVGKQNTITIGELRECTDSKWVILV